MTKQLLDNFFKSKLNNIDYPYSEENWAKMEKMLSKESLPTKIQSSNLTGFLKYYIAAGVTIASVVAIFCITSSDSDTKVKSDGKVSPKSDIPATVTNPNTNITTESYVISKPEVKVRKIHNFKNEPNEYSTQMELDEIAPEMDVNSMINSVSDDKVHVEYIPMEQTLNPVTEKPNVTVENIEKAEPVKPKPVPAAELMKKKRGLLYYLGIRKK